MDAHVTRASLLSRLRDSANDAAWEEFEARYGELILRYALARGLQHADAEDVRQVVLISLSKSLRTFQYSPQRGRFRDYLGRVVRNAVARMRARPRAIPIALEEDMGTLSGGGHEACVDEVWEQEWVDHHYRLALKTVRESVEPQTVAVFERLIAGRTTEEAAREFDLSTQAVHKIKQRIRDRMEELIAAQIREEDEPDEPRFEP